MKIRFLILALLGLILFTGVQGANIAACSDITSDGQYTLTADLSGNMSTGFCLNVSAGNLTIDCSNTYSMTGENKTNSTAIVISEENVTVKNCDIWDYETGVLLDNANADSVKIEYNYINVTMNAVNITASPSYVLIDNNNLSSDRTAYPVILMDLNTVAWNITNNNIYGFGAGALGLDTYDSRQLLFENNWLWDVGKYAIRIDRSINSWVNFTNNSIHPNSATDGVCFYLIGLDPMDAYIDDNLCNSSSGAYGFDADLSTKTLNAYLRNNIFQGMRTAIYIQEPLANIWTYDNVFNATQNVVWMSFRGQGNVTMERDNTTGSYNWTQWTGAGTLSSNLSMYNVTTNGSYIETNEYNHISIFGSDINASNMLCRGDSDDIEVWWYPRVNVSYDNGSIGRGMNVTIMNSTNDKIAAGTTDTDGIILFKDIYQGFFNGSDTGWLEVANPFDFNTSLAGNQTNMTLWGATGDIIIMLTGTTSTTTTTNGGGSSGTVRKEIDCRDGVDNDYDQQIDCLDPDCIADAWCTVQEDPVIEETMGSNITKTIKEVSILDNIPWWLILAFIFLFIVVAILYYSDEN